MEDIMNNFDFTPGPWKHSKGHIGAKIADFVTTDHKNYDGIHIHNGENEYGVSTKESEANARLIASAPEMLETLVHIIKTIENIKRDPKMIQCIFFEDDKSSRNPFVVSHKA
jgi:hypothetical protein